MTDSAARQLADDPSSRKRFFTTMGSAGAAGIFGTLLAACGDDDDEESTPSGSAVAGDLEILNYALTLEHLEADFYEQVLDSGQITDRRTAELAKRFGATEREHVDVLTATISRLGGKPVATPKTAFEAVISKGPKTILATAATVENLGAAAYLGQAPNIKSREILAAALAIHTVEARHAATLNQLVGRGFQASGELAGSIPDGAFARPMDKAAVLKAAAPFIAT